MGCGDTPDMIRERIAESLERVKAEAPPPSAGAKCPHGYQVAFGCHDCTAAYNARSEAETQLRSTVAALVAYYRTTQPLVGADLTELLEELCTHYDRTVS